MSALLIDAQGLEARYGDRTVLEDVNFSLRPREIMVIMGGSGSGKSTLLRHLLGLEIPVAGQVRILDTDLTAADWRARALVRRKTGVAFQSGALFSSLTVGENIMLPLREHTRLHENTMRIMMRLKLEFVNLPDCENRMPAELSGGMIKRAAVARAIIMDPALVFLDEPSAGLDPVVSASLDELMVRLRDVAGMSLVVVTHELESAFRIADRITVLDKGRILACGTPDEIRASPIERVQSLIHRRIETHPWDAAGYLQRLTQGPRDTGAMR